MGWIATHQALILMALTFVNVALTLIYVLATIRLVRYSRKSIETIITLEKSRARPYVIFLIVSDSPVSKTIQAQVKNYGASAANDIRIVVSPSVTYSDGIESSITSRVISALAPGETITDRIDSGPQFFERYKSAIFEGKISYLGVDSASYEESFRIDPAVIGKRRYRSTTTIPQAISELGETLNTISGQLRHLLISEREHKSNVADTDVKNLGDKLLPDCDSLDGE